MATTLVLAAALASTGSVIPAAPARALVTARTLVIDALGTRTVDTHTARVPFGHTALLESRVPYAGPSLSFRLRLGVSAPQPSGIPVRMVSQVWPGPPDAAAARTTPARDELTILSRESSYLLELHYDSATERRILLSLGARAIGEDEEIPEPPPAHVAGRVQFLLEIARQRGDRVDPVDVRQLDSFVGRPVRYESGVRPPGGDPGTILGSRVVLTPERSRGNLVTVKLEISGAEALGPEKQVESFRHTEIRTVTSGSRFEVTLRVPPEPQDGETGITPVTYRVAVTTILG